MKMIPSLRERKRYLLYKVISDKQHSNEKVKEAVLTGIKNFLGTYGMAKAGIMHVTNNILRITHTETDKVKTALSLISEIDGQRTIVQTKYVSGSLNKIKTIGGV